MNNALHHNRKSSAGFTLVEIMIVVSIIAMLAAFAIPSYQRARKRGQASRVLNDLRLIDNALDRWATENNKLGSDTATITDLKVYLKTGSSLYDTGTDILGNVIGPSFIVDTGPKVPTGTFNAMTDAVPDSFWSPYR